MNILSYLFYDFINFVNDDDYEKEKLSLCYEIKRECGRWKYTKHKNVYMQTKIISDFRIIRYLPLHVSQFVLLLENYPRAQIIECAIYGLAWFGELKAD